MACRQCKGISIKDLEKPNGYQHASSFRALKASAETCSLCALLWNAAVTNDGCVKCNMDVVNIHEEPIVLSADHEMFGLRLTGIAVSSHGEDENFRLPGRVFGRIALYVQPGRLLKPALITILQLLT
jgi:hypothetical protein